MKIIKAAADSDRDKVLKYSQDLGFLTGYETKVITIFTQSQQTMTQQNVILNLYLSVRCSHFCQLPNVIASSNVYWL